MASEFEPLEELAEAVLLGQPVDWASAESSAGAANREAVRQLKVLAHIAELHRNLAYDIPSEAPPKLERWGRLELLERIGSGSFGDVYRAWDSKLDREVAVKLLHADGGQPEGATVLKEARLLARVRHPNVVTVYDADEIDGQVGLWMEFIHGRDLEQILGERNRLEDREVTRIGIEVCRALAAVHDAGLLHRDIKAQNVMQTAEGRLVLMDFGTGRELDQTPSEDVDTAGTPLYLAPELFGGGDATVQSDVYSTGVLLFHLLTGSYPVRGATVQEVHDAHARRDRLDLETRAPRVTRTLAAVIGRAIRPDTGGRFESTRGMLAALENVERRTEARKRKRSWMALGAVSLVAIVLAALPGMKRGDRDRPQGKPSAYFGVTPEKRVVKMPRLLFTGIPSPDGRYLPYSEMNTGNLALYEFATGTSRVLRKGGNGDDTFAVESIVSADSRQVAYNWNEASCDCVQLRVTDSTGANDRLLATTAGQTEIVPLEWSGDGAQILGTRKRSGGGTDVVLISTSDGSIRLIRTFSEGGNVTLSPDARYIAYERAADSNDSQGGIYVSAIDGSEEVPVATGSTSDSHPMWTPDGSGLVFMSMRTGGLGLWLQPIEDGRPDGQPQLLEKDMGPFDPITLTHRGSLFYRERTGLMDVYTAPIDSANGDIRGEPAIVATRHLGSNLAADWSADGRTLVFASWRTTGRNVLVFHSMETGLDRDLELDLAVVNAPHWSPDGRLISVGGQDKKGLGALRLIDPQSGRIMSTLFTQSGMPPLASFAWDPDGKHLYLRRNSRPGISRFALATGKEQSVYDPPPDSYLGRMSLAPDGRWLLSTLYRRSEKAFRLILIPTGGGASRSLVTVPEPDGLELGDWTPDGKEVLFVRVTRDEEQKKHGEVFIVPFEGGSPRSLGLKRNALRELRVSPTGEYISFTAGFPDKELWVFENFLPETATE